MCFFFFSSRRRHTRCLSDWSSDVCSSDLATSRCRRIFGSALNNYRHIAMMLGLPPDAHPRELVKIGRTILTGSIAPKIFATGPVKENILKGADVDLYEFPTPHWNRLDGGRYLLTYGGCVTKDPETS